MGKTKANFVYNSLYQVFSIVVPIILAPYLSRRLGADGIGVYSYTYSIVYYFMLLIMLGVNNYGSRVIAKCRNDRAVMSKKFCEIYSIQLFLGVVALLFYVLFLALFAGEYHVIFLTQGLFVMSAALDVNWFFFGLEDFKVTVSRSFIVRLINFVLILVLVRNAEDLWIYALIMSATAFVNQIVLWPFLFRRIDLARPHFAHLKRHLKPLCVLFIPVVAVSLYKIMDKIMLGALSNMDEVGLYEYAEKINSIPLVIISALGTVMLPKISSIVEDKRRVNIYLAKAAKFVLFLTVPLVFVFALTASTIIPLYLGEGFAGVSTLVIVLSFSLPFVSIASVLRTQYLIPAERDRVYTFSVITGAVLNLVVNFILIPLIGGLGACIGTVVSEVSVMIFQMVGAWREVGVKKMFSPWAKLFFKSIMIFLLCLPVSFIDVSNYVRVAIQILLFAVLYIGVNGKYVIGLLKKEKRNV